MHPFHTTLLPGENEVDSTLEGAVILLLVILFL